MPYESTPGAQFRETPTVDLDVELEELLAAPSALTATDRCDRCSAAAKVRAVLPTGGELLFCGHHFNEHSARLGQLAAVLHRDRVPSQSAVSYEAHHS